jgi:hypothetical protein
MVFLRKLYEWWLSKRSKSYDQLLVVEFDDVEVRVRVLERLGTEWNQSFRWADVVRVCFQDGGLYSSDVILVELKDCEKRVAVLSEAKGGNEFLGVLTQRGLFPEEVWRKAIGETGGAIHCWPPQNAS